MGGTDSNFIFCKNIDLYMKIDIMLKISVVHK